MIISHRHRFIFIHCRKTGGSSIARALAPHLGPDDIHLGTWPEAYKTGVRMNRRAHRDLLRPSALLSLLTRLARRPTRAMQRDYQVHAMNGAQRFPYRSALGQSPEHPNAEALARFAPAAWMQYFKFCFVRNPYDRAWSDYRWRSQKYPNTGLSFRQFLSAIRQRDYSNKIIPKQFDNWPMYTLNNQIAVDFVGRFEQFEQDLQSVFARLGLPLTSIPHEKQTDAARPSSLIYGTQESQLIEQIFAREIEYFDFAPPAPKNLPMSDSAGQLRNEVTR